jgi:hypothetical protein
VWTSCPTGTLRVRVQDDDAVHRYAFGTRTAVFHVCSRCGVVPVVTCELDGRTYAVVSVNAFEDVDPALLQRDEVSFDARAWDDRLARPQDATGSPTSPSVQRVREVAHARAHARQRLQPEALGDELQDRRWCRRASSRRSRA